MKCPFKFQYLIDGKKAGSFYCSGKQQPDVHAFHVPDMSKHLCDGEDKCPLINKEK